MDKNSVLTELIHDVLTYLSLFATFLAEILLTHLLVLPFLQRYGKHLKTCLNHFKTDFKTTAEINRIRAYINTDVMTKTHLRYGGRSN